MNSSQGNKYLLIMYVYDANTILEEPLKSSSGNQILETYTNQVEYLKKGATDHGYIGWIKKPQQASRNIINRKT